MECLDFFSHTTIDKRSMRTTCRVYVQYGQEAPSTQIYDVTR